MFDLPEGLPAELVPLSWLIGVWEGTGVIDYEAGDHHYDGEFTHRVSFSHDGGAFLNYSATAWLHDDDRRRPLVAEVGFWRLGIPATDADAGPGLLPALDAPRTRAASSNSRSRACWYINCSRRLSSAACCDGERRR